MEAHNGYKRVDWKITQWSPKRKKILKDVGQLIIGLLSVYWAVYKNTVLQGENKEINQRAIVSDSARIAAENENKALKRTVNEIVVKVVTDNYHIDDLPLPMGYKLYDPVTGTFSMVKVNTAYKDMYATSNIAYFGQQDSVVHKAYGNQYKVNDLKVISGPEKKVWRFYENAITADKETIIGEFRKWKVVKEDNQYLYFLQTE